MENDVKPGYRTTEFWGKNLVQLVALTSMLLSLKGEGLTREQQHAIVTTGTVVIAAIEAVYTLIRGWVKKPS